MTKNSDIPQARSRDLRLVFTRNHAAEYELSTIEVNGLKATASKKRDKRNGDSFQWKPSSGIAALSLFFVETWLHLQRGTPTVEHLRRPVPLEVIPIWNAPLNSERELSIEHPLAKIRVNLIRNRLRSSLYLYRLFYQNELNTHQVSFLELNQSQAPNEPAVVRTI